MEVDRRPADAAGTAVVDDEAVAARAPAPADGERAADLRPGGPGPELGYRPTLDGLRGVALLAILAFHVGVPGAGGAFLGVSTFFTLSGFLITTITLADHGRTGRVGIRRFYGRRARRLLPASVVAVAAITVLTLAVDAASQVIRLRGDALSALFYVENWHKIAAGDSYADLFNKSSLFTHFWSLGIEEQFYIVFPLALAGALWLGRGSRRWLAIGAAAAAVASTAWSAWLVTTGSNTSQAINRAYFGTDTRLAELAVGCLLALWWNGRRAAAPADGRAGGRAAGPWPGRAVEWGGVAALAGIVVVWHTVQQTDEGLYRGGLAAYALLSALVIVAALRERGPVPRLLGWRPLVYVGTISYGAYLIHWPIAGVLVQQTRLAWEARLVIVLVLTLVLATASYRWLERPIRSGRWPAPRVAPKVAVGALVATGVAIVAVTAWHTVPGAPTDFQAAADRLANPVASVPDVKGSLERLARKQAHMGATDAPRVAFFGDSSAVMTGIGVADWGFDHLDKLAPAPGIADLGCGLIDRGQRKVDGQVLAVPSTCPGWQDRWAADVADHRVDVAVVQFGPWDVRDQQLTPGGPFLVIGRDPQLDAELEANLDGAVTRLLGHVGEVVLVASPDIDFGRDGGKSPARPRAESDPARMARYRQIVRAVAARHQRAAVLDLAGWLDRRTDDHKLRPDGVHFSETSTDTVARWLAPQILELYRAGGGAPAR